MYTYGDDKQIAPASFGQAALTSVFFENKVTGRTPAG